MKPFYRKEHEPPYVTSKLGMRYHHIGIPTTEVRPNEIYIEQYKMHVSGFNTSEYGIEFMRFEPDSPIAEIIQQIPHIAFEVDDLDKAIIGKELIGEVSSPMAKIRVAMILEDGAPVEFIEFNK